MLVKAIVYYGHPCALACDAQCQKAWGSTTRPRIERDADNPDDICWLADGELETAPADPGTYEGGCAKPTLPSERLNKWCARECERSRIADQGELVELPDWSKRRYNLLVDH